ncbi:MAG: multidrug transporter permease [Frondihabitans sp.]|nr:multidrug transporter permease [Frondihabitans sp.]
MRTPLPRGSSAGLVIAVVAAFTFGTSGSFAEPLLKAGWSPAAAVTVRALTGGILLAPLAAVLLRGRWRTLWTARWRILAMAMIGVAGTQLAYFAALETVPVGTAILLEYMAPLLLVAFAWATTRRIPQLVVLAGSAIALVGLILVVAPGGGKAPATIGILFAVLAMIGCAVYYVVAAAPSDGLPPVAYATASLLIGGVVLGVVGASQLVPFEMTFGTVRMFGGTEPWWLPVLAIGLISTAIAYTTNITASELLGSRLASFLGLLEVVAATFYAWILLGQALALPQLLGGALILAGIAFVRAERKPEPEPEPARAAALSGADASPRTTASAGNTRPPKPARLGGES